MTKSEFTHLVEATQETLRRFLVALCCGDEQKADDIAQESYMRAYLSMESFRSEASFATWLRRIAYNVFISDCRSCRPSESEEALINNVAEQSADDNFRYQELYSCLGSLPPKERMAITLYYLEGYSSAEIAQIMSANEAAVRQLMRRGRNHLGQLLNH